jgi:hypothetical protein
LKGKGKTRVGYSVEKEEERRKPLVVVEFRHFFNRRAVFFFQVQVGSPGGPVVRVEWTKGREKGKKALGQFSE